MTFPLQDRNALFQHLLPADPEPDQVVNMPEGQVIGGANVINIYMDTKLIGSATQLSAVPNVSGKYDLTRVSSKRVIKLRDTLQVVGRQFVFNSVIFVEYFGWVGKDTVGEPQILSDKLYTVLAALPIGPNTEGFQLYEKVCLDAITTNGDKK